MTGPDFSKLIYLTIIGAVTAGLVLLSLKNLIALARLRSGMTSTGRIVGKRIDSDDGRFYYVTYAFEDDTGNPHQKEIQLRKAAYESLREGQNANVVYQVNNPGNSYLGDPRFRRSYFLATCGWLFLAALLAYVAYNFVIQCIILDICPPEN